LRLFHAYPVLPNTFPHSFDAGRVPKAATRIKSSNPSQARQDENAHAAVLGTTRHARSRDPRRSMPPSRLLQTFSLPFFIPKLPSSPRLPNCDWSRLSKAGHLPSLVGSNC
jgi:hypothetical protein